MFDNLKGMASMAGLMKDLPRIKQMMEEAKTRLGETRVTAETGGGAVTAVANGQLREVRAQAILGMRKTKGGFKSVEELEEVKGIGSSMIEILRPYVTLTGETTARKL